MSEDFDTRLCLAEVRIGDTAAARRLIAHLYPLVRRIVRNHLPKREEEEDLAQEVFLKIFQRLDQFQERRGIAFEHWVARVAVRTCLDKLRAERRRPELRWADLSDTDRRALEWLHSSEEETTGNLSAAEARIIIQRLLAALPPEDRLVLTLLDLEQRSTLEISQETGWSRPAVKMKALRARHRLRQLARRLYRNDLY